MNQNCYQNSVFWAKNIPQMRLRPGVCPGPHWGSLQRSPRPPSWGKGMRMGKGMEERGEEGEGRGEEGLGEGRGRGGSLTP